jgi:DNA-binding protein HU-beta
MNKSQLVDALADRLGDRRTAATAVDALLQIVVDTVRGGDSVSLAGFGVFESRARAARVGRNPRTGDTVDVPATTVPAFRPGTGFRNAVAGDDEAAAGRRPSAAAPTSTDAAVAVPADAGVDGAGVDGALDVAVVNGAVDVDPPDVATTLPAPEPAAGAGRKAGRGAQAEKPTKAEKPAKAAKADKPQKPAKADAGKDKKKGKKGKK